MRVITCNVNGIRSACAKGLTEWLRRQNPDFVCFQEVRAAPEQMPRRASHPRGFYAHYFVPNRKGYSGVGIWSRRSPDRVERGLGVSEWDAEARVLRADFGHLTVASLYVPSGSSGEVRQQAKFRFMDDLLSWLKTLMNQGRQVLIAGDWNIAHKPIDLRNWRSNQKNSGFLPEERAYLDRVFDEVGYVDVFRRLNPHPDQYTWWSNRGRAWENNVGWRLDYQIATPNLASVAASTSVYTRKRFSDHAPLTVDYRDSELALLPEHC
ncbi:MAG: exodeoxyribonuclease III [Myxococcota bacterium]